MDQFCQKCHDIFETKHGGTLYQFPTAKCLTCVYSQRKIKKNREEKTTKQRGRK